MSVVDEMIPLKTPDARSMIRNLIRQVDFAGRSLLSINDLANDQIYALFELAGWLEQWKRAAINLSPGSVMATLFFQPSTRTRMSFETAMLRVGGAVITETTPMISSSAVKEESLADTLKVVSKYANVIVMRHPDEVQAREAAAYSESPVINGGFGHWEHPTQALLDLYLFWRIYHRIEGLKVCIASPDLTAARTGHSLAYGLARLGAEVTFASPAFHRMPAGVMSELREFNANVREEFDFTQDSFNQFIHQMDLVYFPGCSAPSGAEAEMFKQLMGNYFVRYQTLEKIRRERNHIIYIAHPLPRRTGEIDCRIDSMPNQLYFEAITHSIPIRMALLVSILGI